MSDRSIGNTKQQGRLYFWKYKSQRSSLLGWHTTANNIGCEFIIDLIDQMLNSMYSSKYIFKLYEVNSDIVAVPNFREDWRWVDKLILHFPKDKVDKDYWELSINDRTITLKLGEHKLSEFRQGYIDVIGGEGDYAIGHESNADEHCDTQLTFWWHK